MKVAVMTDSNSGIFKRDGEAMGVFVVPMPVVIDDKTYYEIIYEEKGKVYRIPRPGVPANKKRGPLTSK